MTHGAIIEQIADAMDLTSVEVAAGLRSWAEGQRRFGHITDAEHDAVFARLAEEGHR